MPLSLDKLHYLQYLKQLENLTLGWATVDDVHLQYLRELPKLKSLYLPADSVSIKAIDELLSSTILERLVIVCLEKTDETTREIELLRAKHPAVNVIVRWNERE